MNDLNPFLDHDTHREHRARNFMHSILLIGGMAVLLALAAFLIFGASGIVSAFASIAILTAIAPRLPPETVMRLYRAKPVGNTTSPLAKIMTELTARAKLGHTPALYVIPSATLNAFATGTREHAAIAVTEGLLRRLTLREIAGVLAHEISHVRNNDLWLMGLADLISRFVQILSYTAVFLALFNIFGFMSGEPPISWLAIALLYLAPTFASLLQLALSRAREFDADLEAAMITGDPTGLASALKRVDNETGRFWEDMMMPVPARRIPQPSVLRTHPPTEDRIARLMMLRPERRLPPMILEEQPMVSMIGMGPIEMRPRYRWPGLWY